MTVSQLASRTGVAPSTLRYYETLGLLEPERADNGYRTYDDESIDRLRFVAAAKSMDLGLTTIAGLVAEWKVSACARVKSELRPVVEARLATALDAHRVGADLVRHLRASLEHLDALPDRDERCDPGCAFLGTTPAGAAMTQDADSPVVCSLTGDDHRAQVDRWRTLVAGARVVRSSSGASLDLGLDQVTRAAELMVDEVRCCAFLSFRLDVGPTGATLEVSATPAGQPMIDDLLGPATATAMDTRR